MRYQNKQPKRQFIAGAVCQGCGAVDTTALNIHYDADGHVNEFISCAECDFIEHRPSPEELQAMQAQKEAQRISEQQVQANTFQAVKFKP